MCSEWRNHTPESRLWHMIREFGFDGAVSIARKRQKEANSQRESDHYNRVAELWAERNQQLAKRALARNSPNKGR